MISVRIELLTGAYRAARSDDRSKPEWPPHPSRLFCAMVAAWAEFDRDPRERMVLEQLERGGAPELAFSHAPATTAEHASPTVYVPVNDASKVSVLPWLRVRQPRAFPAVHPPASTVWMTWREFDLDADGRVCLDRIAGRVGRLGHSSSFVACRLEHAPPEPVLVPRQGGLTRIRVPVPGMFNELEDAYAEHQGNEARALPFPSQQYGRPPRPPGRAPSLGGDWVVLTIDREPGSDQSGSQPLPTLGRSLELARAVRGALLAHAEQPPPELLTGHRADRPDTPTDRPHLAVVPLPHAGTEHGDGTIRGVALVLPASASVADRIVVETSVNRWANVNGFEARLGGPGRDVFKVAFESARLDPSEGSTAGVEVLAGPAGARLATLRRRSWCRPARIWRSVTPVALDRAPGNLLDHDPARRDRALAEAVETIKRACGFAGLPEPVRVVLDNEAFSAGVPPARAPLRYGRRRGFAPYGAPPGRNQRVLTHVEMEFNDPITGPVLIGAGRYLGYGLCRPVVDSSR